MPPVRLSPRAASDLEEIGDYIATDNPLRAGTFVDDIQKHCLLLAEKPKAFPLRQEFGAGVRVAVHGNYLIFFRILPQEIRVDRILHGARNLPLVLRKAKPKR